MTKTVQSLQQELQREIDNTYAELAQKSDDVLFSRVRQAERLLEESKHKPRQADINDCSHILQQNKNKLTATIKQLKEQK